MKPGFFKNEHLAELSPWHRLCFAGLWTVADREGRLEDRPRRIKTDIFPYDDLDVNLLLWDLARAGFIVRYSHNTQPYIALPTWEKHQHPRPDEADSVIPPYEPGMERPGLEPQANQLNGHGLQEVDTVPSLTSDAALTPARSGSGVLDLGSGVLEDGERAAARTVNRAQDLVDLWNATTKPPIPRCLELNDERRRKIRARLQKRPFVQWREVFDAVQASPFCRGENDRGWTADFDWVIKNDTIAAKALERYRTARTPLPPAEWTCPSDPPCVAGTSEWNCRRRVQLEAGRRERATS